MSLYIHRSYPNFNSAAAVDEYRAQRENAKAKSLMRFKEGFQNSINPDSLLALNMSGDEDAIIQAIDKTMLKTLSDKFSQAANGFDLMKAADMAGEAGKQFFKTRELKDLNTFFLNISEATEMAFGKDNEIAIIIDRVMRKESGGKAKLTYLQKLVQRSLAKYPTGTELNAKETTIKSLLQRLSKLNEAFDSNTNKTVHRVANLVTGIFSTDIGEYTTAYIVSQTFGRDLNELLKALTGSRKIKMEYIQELEKFTKTVTATKPMKADASLSNIEIKVESISKDIVFDLGISTKWYRTLDLEGQTGKVKVTTEKLRGLMNFLNKSNTFNTIALKTYASKNDPTNPPGRGDGGTPLEDYNLLIQTIVERNLDTVISGSGNVSTKKGDSVTDFTQYMIINGRIVSIYELLSAILSDNSNRSVWYHATINGQKKVDDLLRKRLADVPSDKVKAVVNSKETQDLIEGLNFQVELRLSKLYGLMN